MVPSHVVPELLEAVGRRNPSTSDIPNYLSTVERDRVSPPSEESGYGKLDRTCVGGVGTATSARQTQLKQQQLPTPRIAMATPPSSSSSYERLARDQVVPSAARRNRPPVYEDLPDFSSACAVDDGEYNTLNAVVTQPRTQPPLVPTSSRPAFKKVAADKNDSGSSSNTASRRPPKPPRIDYIRPPAAPVYCEVEDFKSSDAPAYNTLMKSYEGNEDDSRYGRLHASHSNPDIAGTSYGTLDHFKRSVTPNALLQPADYGKLNWSQATSTTNHQAKCDDSQYGKLDREQSSNGTGSNGNSVYAKLGSQTSIEQAQATGFSGGTKISAVSFLPCSISFPPSFLPSFLPSLPPSFLPSLPPSFPPSLLPPFPHLFLPLLTRAASLF